jgi:hypothetical protein
MGLPSFALLTNSRVRISPLVALQLIANAAFSTILLEIEAESRGHIRYNSSKIIQLPALVA